MLAGLVIAAGVMLVGIVARLFGGKPTFRASVNMNRRPTTPINRPHRSPDRHDPNVIDVEATPVRQEQVRELEK